MTCNYQDCNLDFFHKRKFVEHLAAAHKINIESKNYNSPQWSNSVLGKKKRNSPIMFIFLNLIKSSNKLQIILKLLTLFVNMMVKTELNERNSNQQEKVIKFTGMGKLRLVCFVLQGYL